ncbi:ATPase domain-containing protein [Salinivibrio kushneri]|uniref:non-specific serine/threonine protein kinase n=1 Tax=Salinivibrio kushneri TaxID=1908198 RepID=A0AA47LQJ4_9GAMM|nr:ATPase domain-containing protein [Salinivibrio kushneri]WBA07755.1 AAA family ATPase [Salinivibrio kushneri]
MKERVSSGIPGLDQILNGGLLPSTAVLVRGGPGLGKTTTGLQFLSAASQEGDSLFIGFQEAEEQLKTNATAIGIDVSNITFLSLAPDDSFFKEHESYDIFASTDVEHEPVTKAIVDTIEALKPTRVFVDSFTHLRFLTADVFQYRKEVLSFINYLTERGATVLFTSEHSDSSPDDDLRFLSDGVISLKQTPMGQEICVEKFRGSDFLKGSHQMRNGAHGVEVFPRPLPPNEELVPGRFEPISTGIASIDNLLGGGLEMGTVTMITGPSGIGKSTLSSCIAEQFSHSLGHVNIYLFEEEISSYLHRARQLNIALQHQAEAERLTIEQIEPLQYLADEFASKVYKDVVQNNTRLVVLDSTAGFKMTLREESIQNRLHALAKGLSRINVSVILVNETFALYGEDSISEKGISYLSDTIISLSYYADDTTHSQISVMKKRLSDFDRKPHQYLIGPDKVQAVAV